VSHNSEILIIQSDEKEMKKVEAFIKNFFLKMEIPTFLFNKVLLCISEAVINAIYHGNNNEFTKTVTLKLLYDNGSIFADVIDQGKGFDFMRITDPTKGEFIKRESGRGLHIIKSLSDCLDFKDNGTCVSIIIRIR
jgi:serine/threonine-protein kinase RsbW